jgi:hypothetical protein
MSDVAVRWLKCIFCSSDQLEPGHAVCAECFAKHQAEPEPTAVEILAMDISDLQDDVAELFRRLLGALRLVQAVADGARG